MSWLWVGFFFVLDHLCASLCYYLTLALLARVIIIMVCLEEEPKHVTIADGPPLIRRRILKGQGFCSDSA